MKNIRKCLSVCRYETITQILSSKTAIVLLLEFFFVREYLHPVVNFSNAVHYPVRPFTMPILMSDFFFQITILLGFLVLVCDAPFIKKGYLFLIARSGKSCWMIGEILFLMVYSLFYTVAVFFFTVINLLPNMEWGNDWGKIIYTIIRTDAAEQFDIHGFMSVVVEHYTPMDAVVKTLILLTAFYLFIGLAIFAMNNITHNHIGMVFGIIVISFDVAIHNLFSPWIYRYSPASLIKLSVITGVNAYNPTFSYAIGFFCIWILILIVINLLIVRMRKGINLKNNRRELE